MNVLASALTDNRLKHPLLKAAVSRVYRLCKHRGVVWLLLILGLARAALILMAYPPAHQSDSDLFFLYAERLAGYDHPLLDKMTYPAYPFLILVAYKWLGSAYWLIVWQFFMSASIPVLYYVALKPYSPILAFGVSALMLADFQTAAAFAFAQAEPLYIFLLALTLAIYLRQVAEGPNGRWTWRDSLTGVLMVLLWLTRTIGRYLIWPFAIIYGFYTRDWRRVATLMGGFFLTLAIYTLLSTAALGSVVGLQATDFAFARVMRHHPSWVKAENGPNSQLWLEITASCEPPTQFNQVYCLYQHLGTWEAAEGVVGGAALETIRPHLADYALEVWHNTLYFLSSSAEVYNLTQELPSDIQCAQLDRRIERLNPEMLTYDFDRTAVPILGLAPGPQQDTAFAEYRAIMGGILSAFCPPWPHHPLANEWVDAVMRANRSFGRPNPHLWYGGVFLLTLLIPWARRYLPLTLIVGGTMLTLAISPAMLSVHINPRYVIPVNALRITLLGLLAFIALKCAFYALDWWLARRKS